MPNLLASLLDDVLNSQKYERWAKKLMSLNISDSIGAIMNAPVPRRSIQTWLPYFK